MVPPTELGRCRALIAHAAWPVRLGLAALFRDVPEVSGVDTAATIAQAQAIVAMQSPQIAFVALELPDGDCAEAVRRLRAMASVARVVMVGARTDEEAIVATVAAGGSGFVAVDGQPEEFISALRSVAGGGCAFDPVAMEIVLRTARGVAISRRGLRGGLSSGEQKILPLIAAGKTNREIGAELYLSENTVKTYVSNLLKKLHVARRSEAAAYIARQQLSTHLR